MWKILKVIKKGDYEYALVPNHPKATKNGYVLMHRVVVENSIGRLLLPKEVIHHKDGNKKNNVIDNLEVMFNSNHVRMHKSTGRAITNKVCKECGKAFEIETRKTRKRQLNFFCSRACNGKFQQKNKWVGKKKV